MIREGDVYTTNFSGDLEVVEYIHSKCILIRFLLTGFTKEVRADHIRNGTIKDPLNPTVHGVGYIGVGTYRAHTSGKGSKEYKTWTGMLERCYSPKSLETHPSYHDCTVHIDWHNFQNFANWFEDNYIAGMHLDKDKLIEGNREYSPDACCFITQKENNSYRRKNND